MVNATFDIGLLGYVQQLNHYGYNADSRRNDSDLDFVASTINQSDESQDTLNQTQSRIKLIVYDTFEQLHLRLRDSNLSRQVPVLENLTT